MYNIMLVDTDKSIRSRFKKNIHSFKLDFKLIKEAKTYQEALDYLEASGDNIDLILSDMDLDNYTAYHLFNLINEEYNHIKMIIYTNYDKSDYIEKAMRNGLLDYIYKPVKLSELERSMERARKIIDEEKEEREEEKVIVDNYNELLPVFKNNFLTDLVHGHYEKENEIIRNFIYFNIDLKEKYTVAIVKIDYYDKLSLAFDEREKQIIIHKINYYSEKFLRDRCSSVSFVNRYKQITIIIGEKISQEKITALFEELLEIIRDKVNISVTIGIGRQRNFARNINISYKQAKAAIRHNYYLGYNSVIHIDYVEKDNHITYNYPLKKEELLVYEAVIGNYEKVKIITNEIFDILNSLKPLPSQLLPKIILDIVVSINRYSNEKGIDLNNVFKEHISIKDISSKDNLKAAREYMINILKYICIEVANNIKNEDVIIIEKVKNYIDNNYYEVFSMSNIAGIVNTTSEHLGKLFKKYEKISLYDYNIRVRMKKAKEYMDKYNLSDEEIAKKIGYDNTKYFEQVFYKIEGITTYDYRNMEK